MSMPLWVQVLAAVEVSFVAVLIAAWATPGTRLIFRVRPVAGATGRHDLVVAPRRSAPWDAG
jgi:hypothetical protein